MILNRRPYKDPITKTSTTCLLFFLSPYFDYLQMLWGVSPIMNVVCLVWWTLLFVKVTGWSTFGVSSLVVVLVGIGGLCGGLSDKLWKGRTSKLGRVWNIKVMDSVTLWLVTSCVPIRWLAGIWENMWRSKTSRTAALLIRSVKVTASKFCCFRKMSTTMKVTKLRLSPNEEAQLIQQEHERRRKLRIQQVTQREMSVYFCVA